ncbi:MAG: serine/threonine protein kinase [Candidatus Abyssobacteria bacterium SURF_5]|uniref:non-specific serine/threonine protein kinase n=1 Tax=Abyssobacteria bacterium (strain SURF_5) TaxID=2093360 RepID=A0A3A4NQL1_ABYX5|nr:MAG: serine/threonine protein kinase [Candidatus Abyssubacteria bacterium SURF_5]
MKKIVENYQILGVIGNPQESRVFLVEDIGSKQKFALKALPMDFFNSEREYKSFSQEFERVVQFRSPNIVKYHKLIGKYTESFLLTEYVEGINLRGYVENQIHPFPDLLHVALQIMKGIQYLHVSKILHQNLKASNILLDDNLNVKLSDFYFSKLFNRWRKRRGYTSVESVRYFSPEQVKEKRVDERSDIYSLGVVLFYLFSRVMPIRGTSVAEIMHKHLRMNVVEVPSTINPQVPADISRVVMKMLEKKPRKRFSSLSELILDLTRMQQRQQQKQANI